VVGWWNEAQRDVHRMTVLGFVPHPNLRGLFLRRLQAGNQPVPGRFGYTAKRNKR
jgi:hypothetical protein